VVWRQFYNLPNLAPIVYRRMAVVFNAFSRWYFNKLTARLSKLGE